MPIWCNYRYLIVFKGKDASGFSFVFNDKNSNKIKYNYNINKISRDILCWWDLRKWTVGWKSGEKLSRTKCMHNLVYIIVNVRFKNNSYDRIFIL